MAFRMLDMEAACEALRQGRVIIYPTETFYGIGCDALNPDAVGAVYAAKHRPYRLPLPVILDDVRHLGRIAAHVYPTAERLMETFWPGPLSLIFPATPEVPDLLTAGSGRIAARLSSHTGAAALCRRAAMILTASSANISGALPVTRVAELDPALEPAVAGIYDAPPSPAGGVPSTIVDVLPDNSGQGALRILREGAVSRAMLLEAGFAVAASPHGETTSTA